jgi:rod shape-determining protein MreD
LSRGQSQPLQPHLWLGLPWLACAAATLVMDVPLRVWGVRLPEPVFPMVLAFAWPVIRPSLLAPFGLLLAGLFLDLFWSAPLGLWGLCLLLAYAGALISRSLMTGRSAPVLAVWYLGLTGIVFLSAYLFVMLRAHVTPNLTGAVLQMAATLALFPFAIRLIDRFEDADIRFR